MVKPATTFLVIPEAIVEKTSITPLSQKNLITTEDYQNSKKKQRYDLWYTIASCFLVLFTLGGLVIAACALQQYKRLNEVGMTVALYNLDGENLRNLYDRPYLQSLYAIPSKNMNVIDSSRNLVDLVTENENRVTKSIKWSNIPDLFDKIWELDDFNSPERKKLREVFLLSENIIYVLLNAYYAKENDLSTPDDYESWITYLNEVGRNPIFLSAIYGTHKHGYITKKFAIELKYRLLKQKEAKEVIEVFWEDIQKKDWAERVGKID